jgi:hypothetical protein
MFSRAFLSLCALFALLLQSVLVEQVGVEAFNIVSVKYIYKEEDTGSSLDKECPCIDEDENGVIQKPCYGTVVEAGQEVQQCFAYDLDDTL